LFKGKKKKGKREGVRKGEKEEERRGGYRSEV
jgi:hypothetical protein